MAIMRNGKVYRNIQEQVLKNTEDIEELNHRLPIEGKFYTEEETDELLALKADKEETNEKLDLKADKSNTYTKTEVDNLLNDKLNIIHLYQIEVSFESNDILYNGLFLYTSTTDITAGSYTSSQLYDLIGYKTIRGSGSAMNKTNEIIRVSPHIEISQSQTAIIFSYYDSIEQDWVDDDVIVSSADIKKLF